ncbi:head-tail connector protein [Chelatococcus sp. GCM10030263]|uniref:head-tail connector protein n=1 Tax=Chelatococcus sp. GCM10030263 TaxID=3273387 RepID=UPI00360CA1A9
MDLVSLETAKRHLNIDFTDRDADLDLKIEQASHIVVDYLKKPDNGWTEETVPPLVQAAVLLVLADLYEHRGDDGKSDPISPAVENILRRYRDPALA